MFYSVVLLTICLNFANGSKILGLFPFPGKSHYAIFDPLMVELAHRGHNVTIYDTFPKSYTIPNYHEIDISNCFGLPSHAGGINQMKSLSNNGFDSVHMVLEFIPQYEEIANCKPLLELWNSTEKYDVLITEAFITDVFYLFGEKLDIPTIAFHTNVPMPWHSGPMGLSHNPAYLPTQFSGYIRGMSFFQRMHNFLMHCYGIVVYKYESQAKYDEIAPKIFGSSVSRMEDIARKVDIMLLYVHFSYNWPRPLVPNVIEVGGLNIKDKKPLPEVCAGFFSICSWCLGCVVCKEMYDCKTL